MYFNPELGIFGKNWIFSQVSVNPFPVLDAFWRPWDPPPIFSLNTLKMVIFHFLKAYVHDRKVALKKWPLFLRGSPLKDKWGVAGGRAPLAARQKMRILSTGNGPESILRGPECQKGSWPDNETSFPISRVWAVPTMKIVTVIPTWNSTFGQNLMKKWFFGTFETTPCCHGNHNFEFWVFYAKALI